MDTSGCTFVKAPPPPAESLLPSRERDAAGVNGGECIVFTAGDPLGEEDSGDLVFSRAVCCGPGSFDGTCRAPKAISNHW